MLGDWCKYGVSKVLAAELLSCAASSYCLLVVSPMLCTCVRITASVMPYVARLSHAFGDVCRVLATRVRMSTLYP